MTISILPENIRFRPPRVNAWPTQMFDMTDEDEALTGEEWFTKAARAGAYYVDESYYSAAELVPGVWLVQTEEEAVVRIFPADQELAARRYLDVAGTRAFVTYAPFDVALVDA